MELIYRIILFLAGLINVLPAILSVLPARIPKSYGINMEGPSMELLLRHRAIFFAMIGGLMIYSALSKNYYELSTLLGLISMLSFVLLYFLISGEISKELSQVMKVDVLASLFLLVSFVLFKIK